MICTSKEFGKQAFENVAYFNFDEQPDLKQFFEATKDTRRLIQNLSLVNGSPIEPGKTLVILDEIQECKAALNSLKYFNENAPQYALAGAGSLLGVTLENDGGFPVGKTTFLETYPLTFLEFLDGADPQLAAYIRAQEPDRPVPDLFFNALTEKLKQYFISGGMPEPARSLVEELDVAQTQQHLMDILNAYQLDFSKHVQSKDISKISYTWESIPWQLARENKKFFPQFDVTPRYWTSNSRAEVDFLVQFRNDILPIEVKSNEQVKSQSLTRYGQAFQPKLKIRYSLKNLQYRDGLANIPLFLIDRTADFIEEWLNQAN